MFSYELWNFLFYFCEKCHWSFEWDSIESVDSIWYYSHFHNIDSFYQGTWNISPSVYVIFDFFHQCHIIFYVQFFSLLAVAAAAKSLQSCPTLCNPIDRSPPGSSVPGILQARSRECVAISFSNAWKWKVKGKSLSRVWFLVTPWTAAHQAPLSMGFSRQECWSRVPTNP